MAGSSGEAPEVDVEKLAEKVYLLMRQEAMLERERGAAARD